MLKLSNFLEKSDSKRSRQFDFWRLDSVRFAAATPSAAFDGRVDALLGKPRAMGLPVGMTLDRIVDTEGHNLTARWLLALAAIYDGAARTEAAKLGGIILSGHAAKQTARRRIVKSKSSSRIRVLTMVVRTKWSSRPER